MGDAERGARDVEGWRNIIQKEEEENFECCFIYSHMRLYMNDIISLLTQFFFCVFLLAVLLSFFVSWTKIVFRYALCILWVSAMVFQRFHISPRFFLLFAFVKYVSAPIYLHINTTRSMSYAVDDSNIDKFAICMLRQLPISMKYCFMLYGKILEDLFRNRNDTFGNIINKLGRIGL